MKKMEPLAPQSSKAAKALVIVAKPVKGKMDRGDDKLPTPKDCK